MLSAELHACMYCADMRTVEPPACLFRPASSCGQILQLPDLPFESTVAAGSWCPKSLTDPTYCKEFTPRCHLSSRHHHI